MRSLLVALDGSPSSLTAGHAAVALAQRFEAHIEALGIVDSHWIERGEPAPVGGFAYTLAADKQRIAASERRLGMVLGDFRSAAVAAGVASVSSRAAQGDPLTVIEQEATAHDLVVIGRDSLIDVDGELCEVPLCVDQVVRGEPRPVLLVPSHYHGRIGRKALVAFDGSPASSRTLHMFALLGLARGADIHVLTLNNASAAEAAQTAGQACALLQRHGAESVHPIGLGNEEAGTASETILGLAHGLNADVVAMGAYGHRGIREIFGSCTRSVLKACPTAIFVHH